MDSFLLIGRFPRSWLCALHRGLWCCSVFRFLCDGGVRLRRLAEVQRDKERRVGAGSTHAETSVHRHQSSVLKSIRGRGPKADGPPVDRLDWSLDRYISLPLCGASSFVTPACVLFLARECQRGTHGACFSWLDAFSVRSHVCVACVLAGVYSFIYTRARVHSTFLSSISFFFFLYL